MRTIFALCALLIGVASGRIAQAQRALVNAIRRSLGKDLGTLNVWMGGALTKPGNWQ
jgi:hypothetical protein